MYYIEVFIDGQWEVCDEGPWTDIDTAIAFAKAEIGVPWRLVGF